MMVDNALAVATFICLLLKKKTVLKLPQYFFPFPKGLTISTHSRQTFTIGDAKRGNLRNLKLFSGVISFKEKRRGKPALSQLTVCHLKKKNEKHSLKH